ncbi:ParB N-terminal domain-containing protein [Reichenbachiella ulvae]|uniref:ParB N-terminal domain-containing protein n=2 Tax=Cytophagales TaxID=768507 RepID=A0ABT3D0P3_9BACT|nr:ParB N-terminal domain-containing protein [Reichenbachiella ulvae]MCV9389482.1 ParB N-terminal domain-containing protein [Reichenbachiella ulvae]
MANFKSKIKTVDSVLTKKPKKKLPVLIKDSNDIEILNELQVFIPPLQEEEFKLLEKSLVEEGVRDPIVVWKEKNVIVDGHNRWDIILKHSLKDYSIKEMSF